MKLLGKVGRAKGLWSAQRRAGSPRESSGGRSHQPIG